MNGSWLQSDDIAKCLLLDVPTPAPGWHYLDPGYPNLQRTETSLAMMRCYQDRRTAHVVVILHVNENHWVVGHWNRATCTFTLYDPLKCNAHCEQVCTYIREWLKGSEEGDSQVNIVQGVGAHTSCAMISD